MRQIISSKQGLLSNTTKALYKSAYGAHGGKHLKVLGPNFRNASP